MSVSIESLSGVVMDQTDAVMAAINATDSRVDLRFIAFPLEQRE